MRRGCRTDHPAASATREPRFVGRRLQNPTMPLTPFQSEVLRLLAINRRAASHIAGGIVLNASATSPRYSSDIDIFHDAEDAVISASEADTASLEANGYTLERLLWTPAFRRVYANKNNDGVRIEWAQDSAWRFFPAQPDPLLGWRLHVFDALTNKALAMGSRSETRDMVDILAHTEFASLPAIVWAACGKDPGFTPTFLLDQMRRNSRVEPRTLIEMGVKREPSELKAQWLELAQKAEEEIARAALAQAESGVVFLAPDETVKWFDTPGATIHRAALGGVIPRLGGVRYEL